MNRNVLFVFLIGLLVIAISVFVLRRYDFFASAPVTCVFKTLGTYQLSTSQSAVQSPSSKGLIYISDLTSWSKISYQKPSDSTYSYTDFSAFDTAGVDVKSIINKVMNCNQIPEFSNTVGVNTAAALILCLQSNTTPGSRVFFVKCFVPRASASDSNSIVGEIGGNTIAIYHDDVKPVAVIQGAIGIPNATDTYTLSYTICAAASRPSGFSYTDCCKSILDTTAVTSTAMASADITNADGTQCVYPPAPKTIVSTGSFSGLGDPTCAKGKYSVVTAGPCTGTVDTDAYLLVVKKSIIGDSSGDWLGKWGSSGNSSGSVTTKTVDSPAPVDYSSYWKKPLDDSDSDLGYLKPKSGGSDSLSGLSAAEIAKLKALANNTTPTELSLPQKYGSLSDPKANLKPGLSDCQKYYNCQKYDDEDQDNNDYEGQC